MAALVRSHFPDLSNDQLRQVLRNTASLAPCVSLEARCWDDRLGYGLLDAHRAVALSKEQLCRDIRSVEPTIQLISRGGKVVVEAEIENHGAFDSERAIAVDYDGDPARPSRRRRPSHEGQGIRMIGGRGSRGREGALAWTG